MLKIKNSIIAVLLSAIVLVLCCACGNKNKDSGNTDNTSGASKPTYSIGSGSSVSSEVSSSETGTTSKNTTSANKGETYSEGNAVDLLDFDKPRDLFGETSITIIGDSISQGLNAVDLYDQSWASLFKNAVSKRFGANNMGYTSLCYNFIGSLYPTHEIHTVTVKSGTWNKLSGWEATTTPGNFAYVSPAYSGGSDLQISLNRKEGGVDRHINGFYIYYTAGATYGSFDVKVNGTNVATVDCNSKVSDTCARSQYIALPSDCGDNLQIDIIKKNTDYKIVSINGISYIDKPNTVTVNNYSLSGICLKDYDDKLLEQLCKANIVIFTLGTNDAGTETDIELFKHKLDVVVKSCNNNGSTLIVGDVIWPRYGNSYWADSYKNALKDCAAAANGYYVNFVTLYEANPSSILEDSDICHPTIGGHKLIAEKLCNFFNLN